MACLLLSRDETICVPSSDISFGLGIKTEPGMNKDSLAGLRLRFSWLVNSVVSSLMNVEILKENSGLAFGDCWLGFAGSL